MSTFGIIVGNRGFFPDHLARSGREQIIAALTAAGHDVVCPTPHQTKHGAVESRAHAKIVADLFRQNRDRIEGIIITLPNFGEERAMADTLRLADLNVPVLIHAFPDNPDRMLIADRRDSFCGKMSICNNLKQYRIPYSLTTLHTEGLDTDEFKNDIAWFAGVCRVTNGLRKLRIGAIGARPAAFNTVRYSEKLLEMSGITVEPLDLSEVFGRIAKLASTDAKVQAQVEAIRAYVSTEGIPAEALAKMAKLGVVVAEWMGENDLQVSAVQCWTSMEEYFGVVRL
jgi:L-fucose isomerase-like protein